MGRLALMPVVLLVAAVDDPAVLVGRMPNPFFNSQCLLGHSYGEERIGCSYNDYSFIKLPHSLSRGVTAQQGTIPEHKNYGDIILYKISIEFLTVTTPKSLLDKGLGQFAVSVSSQKDYPALS